MAKSAEYEQVMCDLPIASRILADHKVVDAFGHVSARNPDDPSTFIMSRNLAPALVTQQDLLLYNVEDASPVDTSAPRGFLERHIHASLYKLHPTINAIVHFHAFPLIPYGILGPHLAPFKAVYHMAAFLSSTPAPIFDIADQFGPSTDILITSVEKGDALAREFSTKSASTSSSASAGQVKDCMARKEDKAIKEGVSDDLRSLVLMRGHGATLVAADLRTAAFRAVYAVDNAEILQQALRFAGPEGVRFLSEGECESATMSIGGQADRPWGLWSSQVSL